jgi:hypothetical protein
LCKWDANILEPGPPQNTKHQKGRFTPRRTIAEKELRTQEQDETDGKDENWEIIGIGLVFCGAEALNARESYMKTAAITPTAECLWHDAGGKLHRQKRKRIRPWIRKTPNQNAS